LAICTLALGFTVSGCTSARAPRYYQISLPHVAPPASEAQFPVSLVVGRLSAPHVLRDDRVVYDMSDVELGLDEYHRWAEPPTGMIERLLVERLRNSGRYLAVQRLTSSTRGDFILRGYLGALNEVDDPAGLKARFTLQLELFDVKQGRVVWTDSFTHDEPVAKKTVSSVVEALQTSVRMGLDQLSANLAQFFSTHSAH
jgi:ABC-type uncharacterized transport system auxiliary subunit